MWEFCGLESRVYMSLGFRVQSLGFWLGFRGFWVQGFGLT